MTPHVLTVVEDLMFRPNVTSQIRAAGLTEARYRPEAAVAEQVPEGGMGVGLVDLSAKGADPLGAAQAMLAAGLPVVGFCGHADAETRAAAKAAGVTVVAARSEVHGGLKALIARALAHTPDPDCDHC
jgi:hypothetical protein